MARDRLLKAHLRDRFVVTLTNGEAFSGLLDEWDERHVILVDASQVAEGRAAVPVAGKLFLPRERVAYFQKPA